VISALGSWAEGVSLVVCGDDGPGAAMASCKVVSSD